jgi:tRNA (guanine-N7-)-methyltransferase
MVAELLPQLQITLPSEGVFNPITLFDFAPSDLWFEIGFGGGEHLATQAARHSDIAFIGCEPFLNGIASLCDYIDRQALKNIRIFPDDARYLLDALPEQSLGRCFILFSDPWPKERHAERRFIGNENIARLARVLKPGAELRLATDDAQLAIWMRQHLLNVSDVFTPAYDALVPPEDWVRTRYEEKGIKAGRAPVYFSFKRR